MSRQYCPVHRFACTVKQWIVFSQKHLSRLPSAVAAQVSPQQQNGKGSGKKRKSPETVAQGNGDGQAQVNALPTAAKTEAEDASVKTLANESPTEKQSTPGRKGLASLFGNKGVGK